MKNSGIEWIDEIPEDWDIHPVYSYFEERKHPNKLGKEQNLLSLSYGNVIRKNINTVGGLLPASFNTYNIIEKDDIVIRPTNLQNDKRSLRTGLCKEHGIITSAYITLKPKKNIFTHYYHYLLHAYDIEKVFYNMGNGVRQGLNYSEFSKLLLLIPNENTQKSIAKFLELKCAKIDSLKNDIEKQIGTLEQYKKSVITEAVTKGINTDVKMKDSGIEWIGEIPEHWNVKKIKYIFKIKKDIAGKDGYTVLSITQKDIKPKDLTKNEGQIAESYINYQLVNIGDFAMNHMDLLTGWVDVSQYKGVTSPDYRVFVFLKPDKFSAQYYLYIMQMCYANRIFYSLGQGVSGMGRWRLPADEFLNFLVPIPSLEEQKEIADYLDSKCATIDEIIKKKQQQLETLEEYKKSLIFEYVTGKKEV